MSDGDKGCCTFVPAEAAEIHNAELGTDVVGELGRHVHRRTLGQKRNDAGSTMLAPGGHGSDAASARDWAQM